ncbi:helix-turn-helix transcriptional regulator [Streptacidiphilus sp. 4-A2]|nr:helix-turn-helix transcriptional regulator [Streptacidiphilus sp. 4-A2]
MDDERTPAEDAVPGVRLLQDTDTLKALSDPLRVTMLGVMMEPGDGGALRPWTVKELAAELGEPQTKLYRHIKQLEERGLLRVAGTRLVSGIVEQRYLAAQTGLQLSRDFLGSSAASDTSALLGAGMDSFQQQFAGVRSGSIDLNTEALPGISYRSPLMVLADTRMRPERAAEFRDRMAALIEEYLGKPGEPSPEPPPVAGSVAVNVMLALYGQEQQARERRTGEPAGRPAEQSSAGADPAG